MDDLLEKLRKELVILPCAPEELQKFNPEVKFILGLSKTLRLLSSMNLRGVAVCKRIPLKSDSQNCSCSADQANSLENKLSHGCMFIPAPNFDKVIIVKNVSDLSKEGAVNRITNSILDQLKHLNKVIEQIDLQNDLHARSKINVQLFVCYQNKLKCPQFEKLKSPSVNLNLNLHFIEEKFLQEKLHTCLDRKFDQAELIWKLIWHCSETIKEDFYHLSRHSFNVLSDKHANLEQSEEMIALLDFHFPNRKEKLQFIPHFNQIQDNMLFAFNEDGSLAEFPKYAAYLGEVRLFSEKLLARLNNPKGILLKGFSNQHLKTILDLDDIAPQQFQTDWLYLGCQYIIAFEVGMSQFPQNPTCTICNKIIQTLEKTIPQIQLILYSFWFAGQRNTEKIVGEAFFTFIKKLLKAIIFLPEIKYETFVSEIKAIRETSQVPTASKYQKLTKERSKALKTLTQNKNQLCNLLFIVQDNSDRNRLKLASLNEDLELVDSHISLQELFNSSSLTENQKIMDYFSSLLSVASLNSIQNADFTENRMLAFKLEDRFLSSQEKWCQGKKQENKDGTCKYKLFSKLILSPQQHGILCDFSKRYLVITGYPGTGKTLLLLAKCEQLASFENIDKIYFAYSKKKVLFRKFLEKTAKNCCSEIMTSKMEYREIIQKQDLEIFVADIKNVASL